MQNLLSNIIRSGKILAGLFALAFACEIARAQPSNLPARLELLLPADATATVDEKDAANQRVFDFKDFSSNGFQQVQVTAKFSDGTEAKRLVELAPGQKVQVPINLTPVDRPTTVVTESPVALLWAEFSPDGRWIATAAEDHSVVLWDLRAGRAVRDFPGHTDAVQSVTFSPDSNLLLTASTDGTAALWDARSGRLIRQFKGHAAGVNSAVFSRDGRRVVTGSSDTNAILWDAQTGAQLRVFTGQHSNEVVGVAISPDGRRIATASTDRHAVIWNADTGEMLFNFRSGDTFSGIVFSPDGKVLAASNFENDAYFWEAATGKRLGVTRRVNLDLNAIAFAPDGRRVFTAGKDATAKMWEVNNQKLVREFAGHSTDLQSVAVSPDGRLLLTSSRDSTARLWDIATGSELVSLASSAGGKNWAVVTPDGLFDASEHGRQLIGYRFAGKLPGAVIDQFFAQFYTPGLLAEIVRGGRPMSKIQLGLNVPPLLKIAPPPTRVFTNNEAALAVDVTDQGGGISSPVVFNNGARLPVNPEATADGATVHFLFHLPLARGVNQIRVTASARDGSWESKPAEIELRSSQPLDRKSRLFVVAVGTDDASSAKAGAGHAARNAMNLASLLQHHSAATYDRADVIPVLGQEATRAMITNTLMDVAALTRPQDTLVVILCGNATMSSNRLFFTPADLRPAADGLDGDELAALLGTAGALNRVLILDTVNMGEYRSDYALAGAVERWSRSQGIYVISCCAAERATGLLTDALLGAAEDHDSSLSDSGAISVLDWFHAAVLRSAPVLEKLGLSPQEVQPCSKRNGFPLLALTK